MRERERGGVGGKKVEREGRGEKRKREKEEREGRERRKREKDERRKREKEEGEGRQRRKREKGDTVRILILHLIFHRLTVVSVLFCSLKKALTLTIPMLCFVLIKYRVFV